MLLRYGMLWWIIRINCKCMLWDMYAIVLYLNCMLCYGVSCKKYDWIDYTCNIRKYVLIIVNCNWDICSTGTLWSNSWKHYKLNAELFCLVVTWMNKTRGAPTSPSISLLLHLKQMNRVDMCYLSRRQE